MSYHNVDGIKKFPDHVQVKPDIQRFTETGAEFVDGSEKKFDDVIFCTGRSNSLWYFCLALEFKKMVMGYECCPMLMLYALLRIESKSL